MGLERKTKKLLETKTEKILRNLKTVETIKLPKKYRGPLVSPIYHKYKPEPTYIICI